MGLTELGTLTLSI